MIKDDVKDFEEVWDMFNQQQMENIPDHVRKNIRGIFMSGGYAAVGVLSNRLAELPGTTKPDEMVKALINEIQVAFAELEIKANHDFENKTFGQG